MTRRSVSMLVLGALGALLLTACAQEAMTPAQIAQRFNPSVVTIRTSTGLGTGFVVGKDGWIATNLHVLMSDPSRAVVVFEDHRTYEVTDVVAVSKAHDLVIVHIDAKDLPILSLADSSLARVGDAVVAIGNPKGLERTVSTGVVSALRSGAERDAVIQFSAPISHGSSGGPLLNDHGEVIGVTSAQRDDGQNLNLAWPSNWLKALLAAPHPSPLLAFAAANDERPAHACHADSPTDCNLQCSRGNAASCTTLAYLLDTGRGVAKDLPRALRLSAWACKAGEVRGCNALGYMYYTGHGTEVDFGRAADLFERACGDGSADGCSNLALAYQLGKGVGANPARASELRQRACNAGRAQDCTVLAVGYEKSRSYAKATPLFNRGCDGGDAMACARLGNAYAQGQGAPRDDGLAFVAYERACDRGSREGCSEYGTRLVRESRSSGDRTRGLSLLHAACKQGVGASCDKLREMGEPL